MSATPPERPRRKSRARRRLAALIAAGAACAVLAAVWVGALAAQHAWLSDLPPIPDRAGLWAAGRPAGVTFVDEKGQVIGRRGPRHGDRATLGELPAHVPLAFLAAEDHRFYQHGALDFQGIARAAVANLKAGRTVEGGSTMSQQLARTLLLTPDRTLKRKVQEAVLARRLETMLSKDELLELYLNRVYLGDAAYGVGAAARTYFAKSPANLTLSEAALLASLPKAPSKLALTKDLDGAWTRARLILASMRDMGWITPAQAQAALAAPPAIAPPDTAQEGDLAWAFDMAMRQVDGLLQTRPPDLVIELTVDPAMQAAAGDMVRQAVAQNRGRGVRQAALVALAPDGEIRAIVGGTDHDQSPFNRAWQAKRQPGSSFKPFVWAAALEAGVGPYDLRPDAAVRIGGWSPHNYGGGYHGTVTVAQALKLSLNTVAVRLAREASVERVAEIAGRFGVAGLPAHPGPSIALGAYETTLLELTGAYQVFQNAGARHAPYLIAQVRNARGDVLYRRPPPDDAKVYGQYSSGEMVRMMQGVIQSGTGRRADLGRPAAGKTGTSQDHRDAWFVGFTPDWAAGVWMGDDANRAMRGVTGGEAPAQLWRRFMVQAHQGLPARDFDWAPPPQPRVIYFDAATEEEPAYDDWTPPEDEQPVAEHQADWGDWADLPPYGPQPIEADAREPEAQPDYEWAPEAGPRPWTR